MSETSEPAVRQLVQPAPHEFSANLIFGGLDAYFAIYNELIGEREGTAEIDVWVGGEKWTATWYYQDSGIAPPEGELPSGRKITLDTIREFRCQLSTSGRRSINLHLSPRWPGQTSKTGQSISQPPGIGEAINIRASGSNVPFDRYLEVVRSAIDALGINRRYLSDPHDYSNIQDAELYVRVDREAARHLHARDGTLARLFHVLERDRSGYRRLVQDDRDIEGYYHTVTLGPRRVGEVWPGHDLAKEIKHYHPREVKEDPDNPLYHPKLGVSYQVKQTDRTVYWDELDELTEELEDVLFSVLDDADLELVDESDPYPFVPDDVFEAEPRDLDRVVQLDLSDIEIHQKNVVISAVADGLSPVEFESLETLVADGGEIAPKEIAEEHDRHPDSVRRALRRLEGLVRREYGSAALESPYVAELVHSAVQSAKEHTRRALDASGTALAAAARELTEAEAQLRVWAKRHGINLRRIADGTASIIVDASSKREAWRELLEGFELWTEARSDPTPFSVDADHYLELDDGRRDPILFENVIKTRAR